MAKETKPTRFYPGITTAYIQHPSRLYAIPLFGPLVKIFMLIPVGIELAVLSFVNGLLLVINSFIVLTTGQYWSVVYELTLGIMRLDTKASFFFYGLTNTYPGFDLSNSSDITVDISCPTVTNRYFAIPFLGGLSRALLLIPFFIYTNVIANATFLGAIVGTFYVIFTGKYPESIYELVMDTKRLSLATSSYLAGLSDTYPTFTISMNHQTIKIILIILGVLCLLGQNDYRASQIVNQTHKTYPNQYPIHNPRHRPPYFL